MIILGALLVAAGIVLLFLPNRFIDEEAGLHDRAFGCRRGGRIYMRLLLACLWLPLLASGAILLFRH